MKYEDYEGKYMNENSRMIKNIMKETRCIEGG